MTAGLTHDYAEFVWAGSELRAFLPEKTDDADDCRADS